MEILEINNSNYTVTMHLKMIWRNVSYFSPQKKLINIETLRQYP